ncbi:hypothetical protein ZIOFF_048426 [Zingiber officinale]|uniref:Uncharacterized protein n=1 Tax=Zingiber officinale TaxID=94328 RepID=A0A8J5FV29_ZINOF|nr:hypothetical protein ZIOFF_048426 [Zingiber officinale]
MSSIWASKGWLEVGKFALYLSIPGALTYATTDSDTIHKLMGFTDDTSSVLRTAKLDETKASLCLPVDSVRVVFIGTGGKPSEGKKRALLSFTVSSEFRNSLLMDETLIKGGGGDVNNDPPTVLRKARKGHGRGWQVAFLKAKLALSFYTVLNVVFIHRLIQRFS